MKTEYIEDKYNNTNIKFRFCCIDTFHAPNYKNGRLERGMYWLTLHNPQHKLNPNKNLKWILHLIHSLVSTLNEIQTTQIAHFQDMSGQNVWPNLITFHLHNKPALLLPLSPIWGVDNNGHPSTPRVLPLTTLRMPIMCPFPF